MAEPENPNKQLLDAGAKLRTAAKELKASALQLRQKGDEAQDETTDAVKESSDEIKKNTKEQNKLVNLLTRMFKDQKRLAELARSKNLEDVREAARERRQQGRELATILSESVTSGLQNLLLAGGIGGLISRLGMALANPVVLGAVAVATAGASFGLRGWELGAARRIGEMLRGSQAFQALNRFVSNLGSRIVGLFSDLGDLSGRTVTRLLQPLGAVGRFINQVSSFITGLSGGVASFLGSRAGRALGRVGSVMGRFARVVPIVGQVIGGAIAAFDGITAFMNAEGTLFERLGVGLGAAVGDFFGAPLDLVKRLSTWAIGGLFGVEVDENGNYDESRLAGRLLNIVSDFSFEDLFGNFIGGAFGFMSDLFTDPGPTLRRLWDGVSGGVSNVGQWLWDNTLGAVFDLIGDIFSRIRETVFSLIPRPLARLLGIGEEEPTTPEQIQDRRDDTEQRLGDVRERIDEEAARLEQFRTSDPDDISGMQSASEARLRELRSERDDLESNLERLQMQLDNINSLGPSSSLNPPRLPLENVTAATPTTAARVGVTADQSQEAMRSVSAIVAPTINAPTSTNVNSTSFFSAGQPSSVDPTYLRSIA